MNKLLTKIAGVTLGFALAIGVGTVVGHSKSEVTRVLASSPASVTFSDLEESGDLDNAHVMTDSDISLENGLITFAWNKGSGSTNPTYYSSGSSVRFYCPKSSSNSGLGGKVTIALSNSNYYITSITYNFGGTVSANGVVTAGTKNAVTSNISSNGSLTTATYTLADNIQSVVFQAKNTKSSTQQCYLTGVSVSYSAKSVYATNVLISKHQDSNTPAISEKTIEIEKGAGSGSLYEKLTATATGANSATPTDATVTWSKAGTNVSYVDEWDAGDNSVEFLIDTNNEGTFTVTADADGAQTAHSVTDTITYRIIDPDAAVLDHVSYSVTGAFASTQYAGNEFNADGLTFKAVYDDASEVPINANDIDWNVLVEGNAATGTYTDLAGTTVNVSVPLTVAANTLTISIGGSMAKTSYAQNEAWDPTGLTKSGQYADGTSYTGTISWSYSPATPAGLTVGDGRTVTVTATAESSEFATKEVTVSISEPNYIQTDGIGTGGKFYIMHVGASGVDIAANTATDDTAIHPTGISLSTANNTANVFTLELIDDKTYRVGVGDGTNYLYSTNTNNGAYIGSAQNGGWVIEKHTPSGAGEYDYYTMKYVNTSRYLTSYVNGNTNDFRSYSESNSDAPYSGTARDNGGQHARLMLIPEYYYSNQIVDAIMSNEVGKTLCNNGVNAPSTTLWNSIAGITKIEHELAVLRGTNAAVKNAQGETPTGTTAEKAMARYDEIITTYNTTSVSTYADFLGRVAAQGLVLKSSSSGVFEIAANGNSTLIIILISLISVVSISGYFMIRRRKEQ